MSDDSVYIKIINETDSTLGLKRFDAPCGYWASLPNFIGARSTANAHLKDKVGFYGSEGTFAYYVSPDHTKVENHLFEAYQTCPYGEVNEVQVKQKPEPKAVFLTSWRARSGNNDWVDEDVQKGGHPVHVEYTIKYNTKRFKFKIMHIDAYSGHPVRNSRNELIVGNHRLWDREDPSTWVDHDKGSFQPNVFPYDFLFPVPESSLLKVTIRPVDPELIGAEGIIYGIVNGHQKIMQSGFFFIEAESNVEVHVITPQNSSIPFSWNANVQWVMELRVPKNGVDCVAPCETRLELYWITKELHRALKPGIPISLLRQALLPSAGASHFGVHRKGGNFMYSRYALATETGAFGSLETDVNCMDQAAMLELFLSLGPTRYSWLLQDPFGFIKPTRLVGIPGLCNNPFYGTDITLKNLEPNDERRRPFGLHVYNGYSVPDRKFDKDNDGVYDACGGPYVGEKNAQQFLDSSIDKDTKLYKTFRFSPGTKENIEEGGGVTGIDGQTFQAPVINRSLLPERIRSLIQQPALTTPRRVAQQNWVRLSEWINSVLGEDFRILFAQISASGTSTQASWLVAGSQNLKLNLDLHVVTRVADDGSLNEERSFDAAFDHLASILMSTDRDPQEIWTQGSLNEYGVCSVQYADCIPAGRFVLVSGNAIVDIRGASSSAALLPLAHSLLAHTTVELEDPVPFAMPVVSHHFLEVPEARRRDATHTVKGTDVEFLIHCDVDARLAAASAHVADYGILFSKCDVVYAEGRDSSAVKFTFITRELGTHEVELYFSEWSMMACRTKKITVDVVSDD
ncbi:hypothetical protein ACEPAH_9216 [Sanghuangporus vaninii]